MVQQNDSGDINVFVLPNEQPFERLEVEQAFKELSTQEALYTHYLGQASWYGGLIILFQTSPESPDIFRLIHALNCGESIASLKEKSLAAGVTDTEFNAYLVYASGIYGNWGNYLGFGDSKFVPNLSENALEKIVLASQAVNNNTGLKDVWTRVKGPMYSLSDKEKQLGLGEEGITKYFSANCTSQDSDVVNRFFKYKNIEGWNTRVMKMTGENGITQYEIRNAAVDKCILSEEIFENCNFKVTTGDYEVLLDKVNENLIEAAKHASNDLEKKMIDEYIKSFKNGSVDAHKDGSRYWIKNKGPTVETYIGFIENYRDPTGVRSEFEGFVAVVNKKLSQIFQTLVDNAEELLPKLPWTKEFEKDKFLRPDYTYLEVVTCASSMVPSGINIPNYDDIRQEDGFKNVTLGNVLKAKHGVSNSRTNFLSEADDQLFKEYKVAAYEVVVGLHELLGHGSGKLFMETEEGKNFSDDLKNPLTEKPLETWYKPGENYNTIFTTIGSSYEECRAESVALHLSLDPRSVQIFGHSGEDIQHIKYISWLHMAHGGIVGLEMFSPASDQWKQAHSRARFVILQVMLEAGNGFCKVEQITGDDGKPDLLLTMDRSKLDTVGGPAIAKFLEKLQVYKSTADIKSALAMYDGYSQVKDTGSNHWLNWRDIVMTRKKHRPILVQGNTKHENEKIKLTQYDPSSEGLIKSFTDRFPSIAEINDLFESVTKSEGNHW